MRGDEISFHADICGYIGFREFHSSFASENCNFEASLNIETYLQMKTKNKKQNENT